MNRAGLALALLACGGPSDREVYQRALAGEDAPCASVRGASLRGDCTTLLALGALKGRGRGAGHQVCATLDFGVWRDECHFMVIDADEVRDPKHAVECEQAGRFKHNCLGHIARRAVLHMSPPMGQFEGVARSVAVQLVGGTDVEALAELVTARIVADRFGPVLDVGVCQELRATLCARAIAQAEHLMRSEPGAAKLCNGALDVDRVVEMGGRPWTPASEAVVRLSWDKGCAARAGRSGPYDWVPIGGPPDGARPKQQR